MAEPPAEIPRPAASAPRSGGRILVDALRRHGVRYAFCVPGESYLPVLDALHDTPAIRLVSCRHEGAAAMAAEATGKLSGRPGICFVTRGPGATNASSGLHVAAQDSTPLILFVGQVAQGLLGRDAFQEVDFRRFFAPLVKWVTEVHDPARLPELVNRAFHIACAGRPGPVVVALPEDVLGAEVVVADPRPAAFHEPLPAVAHLARLEELLRAARRPLALVGGPGWDAGARRAFQDFAERQALPVAASFRCQDRIDNRSPCYAGDAGLGMNPALAHRIREADLLLAVGERLGDITTGHYRLLDVPSPRQRLVHVYPDPGEIGRVYEPELAICATGRSFVDAVVGLDGSVALERREWFEAAHHDYLEWSRPRSLPGPLQLADIVAWLGAELPENAIITNGAGNYTLWVHRFYRYRGFPTQLAPVSGSMGYGLPAALAAKLLHPDRAVVCFAGDGCFQMTGQELTTAVQEQLDIIVVVVNNAMYGTIRMHQERRYPGRVYATDLVNPDFVALAEACGAAGYRVERTEDFASAFRAANTAGRPALIELRLDPDVLTPTTSITALRNEGA